MNLGPPLGSKNLSVEANHSQGYNKRCKSLRSTLKFIVLLRNVGDPLSTTDKEGAVVVITGLDYAMAFPGRRSS